MIDCKLQILVITGIFVFYVLLADGMKCYQNKLNNKEKWEVVEHGLPGKVANCGVNVTYCVSIFRRTKDPKDPKDYDVVERGCATTRPDGGKKWEKDGNSCGLESDGIRGIRRCYCKTDLCNKIKKAPVQPEIVNNSTSTGTPSPSPATNGANATVTSTGVGSSTSTSSAVSNSSTVAATAGASKPTGRVTFVGKRG